MRDPPFFASLFDADDRDADADFDRRMTCDGGGGTGSSSADCTTDGGDARPGVCLAPSWRDAAATPRTTEQRPERRGEERVAEVAGRFGRDGDVAIRGFDLRLPRLSATTGGRPCWERKESRLEGSGLLLIGKSAVGDDRGSMESSAGLAIALTSIPLGRGVGGGVMMQSIGVLMGGASAGLVLTRGVARHGRGIGGRGVGKQWLAFLQC